MRLGAHHNMILSLIMFVLMMMMMMIMDNNSLANTVLSYSVSDSKGEAAAIETELLRDYRFGQQQLIEIWGQACALAITKVCMSFSFQICFVVSLFFFLSCFL